jgi:ubiquinone/menaquinone biosynthesis C-methylase UbiE
VPLIHRPGPAPRAPGEAPPTPDGLRARARLSGDPFRRSAYFDDAEGSMEWQWDDLVWPFLSRHPIDFTHVIDLAAGHGRNTVRLLEHAARVTVVDINQSNVDWCRTRFAHEPRVAYLQNDGVTLDGLANGSVSLVYSFDSMVHFHADVVRAYLPEFRRVLQPGAFAFCHHSNYTANPRGDFRASPHARNYLSRSLFAEFAREAGLEVVEQQIIDWGGVAELDCLSLVRTPQE